ncbi:hypothetical protein A2943_00260 [Candidatus Adlerbacteria bacterium RIFCSPLOWO2_01_FULL_51_16]|uniref:Uncharacterized protein n=1 Tax=Candidatus Adlerbacteria bacterium RIFCSPLOWO2_01_FULL_51_16 TaxID=1797243 RepID=A0A1F4XFD4_9BACT|nr:MAG: hypothetical protein A2943_00260 [Candidatus Adlerbacteria bacterium RIFCSPLOWO2_01_FULL_51_16]
MTYLLGVIGPIAMLFWIPPLAAEIGEGNTAATWFAGIILTIMLVPVVWTVVRFTLTMPKLKNAKWWD